MLGQFRDNVLLATNAPVMACRELIQEARQILQEVWSIPVHCNRADKNGNYQGSCLGPVCIAMGYCCARTPEGTGLSHVQPVALRPNWSLCHGPPLLSPQHSYKGYLAGIFSSALANGRRWTHTWAAQILSACAWVHVALLSGYTRADAMWAMHSGIHRAYADSQHNVQGTVKAVYHLSYGLPAKKCVVVSALAAWLRRSASWKGSKYTSWVQPAEAALHRYDTIWNEDFAALEQLRSACCERADCVCASTR